MSNTNTLTTNFNTSPYYDDYNEDKNFYRILFKPGLAVQARELTQLQTILQKQIDRHAEHVFAEGALVVGGKTNVDLQYTYVKVKDEDVYGNDLNLSELVGKKITSANNGINALVVNYSDGTEAADPNTNTLFVKYISSSIDGNVRFFANNETITSNSGVTFKTIISNKVVGVGSSFTIDEGILYAKDHFIKFPKQELILSKYSSKPSIRAGFIVQESIITESDDFTLLDPAQGSYNYAAPGADRLKLQPVLVAYDEDSADIPDDFIQLVHIKEGVIQNLVKKTEYSIIKDEFARRTNDESGSYVVNGMKVRMREHLNDGTNGGYYRSTYGGNSSLLAVGVEPGKAYVQGYEVERLVTTYIPVEKGIDYRVLEEQTISANYGNYLKVNEVVGDWNVNDGIRINLYDSFERRISTNEYSTTTPTGSLIGTALLKTLEYESGTVGANNAIYRAYLTDIKMTNGAFSSVKSMYYNNSSTSDLCADVYGTPILQEKSFDTAVYNIPTSNIRKIRDISDNIDTSYMFKKKFDVSIATPGTFTLSSGSADKIFPYSTGALNATQKNPNFVLAFNTAATVALTGNVSITTSNTTVTGSGTAFISELNVGDKIKFSNGDIRKIISMASETSMVVDAVPSTNITGTPYNKQYLVGDIIDLTAKGATGTTRSVTVTSSTSLSFDLKETLSTTVSASVLTNLSKTEAKEIKKIYRKNRFVIIRPNTNVSGLTGPWNLGVSDVIKINSVRLKSSSFTGESEGTLVTNYFALDDGQKDNLYDHAKLRKLNGVTIDSSSYLLVNLDYFYHDFSQGTGYFSVDSYPIDDVNGSANTNAITTSQIPKFISKTTGITYNLRDSLDTRVSKTNTATDATVYSSATTNPSESTSLNVASGGLHYPAPNENFTMDYSYYLPRKDLIVVSKDGAFRQIKGIPDFVPKIPDIPGDSTPLCILNIAPYPSLPPDRATSFKRPEYSNFIENISIKGYTMKAIGLLEKRIENLEYYVTLSMLEKDTIDTKIVDANGLDRFKNGIFVDPFNDHGAGDLTNPDYSVAIDPIRSEIRPKFEMDDISMVVKTTSGVTQNGDVLTLSYTHVPAISQTSATTPKNTSGLFYRFIGDIKLTPSSDYWVDTKTIPDLQISQNSELSNWMTLDNAWGTQWGIWESAITGVSSVTTLTPTTTSTSRLGGSLGVITTSSGGSSTTTTTTTTSTRAGTDLSVSSSTMNQSYGDRVLDVSIIPYIREQKIQFVANGLKPNTRVYAFFDSEPVTTYTYQVSDFGSSVTESLESNVIHKGTLITDSDGKLKGIFWVPCSEAKKFRTGNLVFRLTDSPTDIQIPGYVTTSAEATFNASGLTQTKQETIVSTEVAQITSTNIVQTKTSTSQTTTSVQPTTTVTYPTNPYNPPSSVGTSSYLYGYAGVDGHSGYSDNDGDGYSDGTATGIGSADSVGQSTGDGGGGGGSK